MSATSHPAPPPASKTTRDLEIRSPYVHRPGAANGAEPRLLVSASLGFSGARCQTTECDERPDARRSRCLDGGLFTRGGERDDTRSGLGRRLIRLTPDLSSTDPLRLVFDSTNGHSTDGSGGPKVRPEGRHGGKLPPTEWGRSKERSPPL